MEIKKLKELRRLKKITLKEISKNTGISRNTLSSMERGKGNPSFSTVQSYIEAIGVKIIITL
jgi:transcriptional regulator with XRE-family HTH domain